MRYQSLAILAKSSIIPLFLSIGLLAGTASATDAVYKWKDANGQSHYSQSVPEGIKYETITPAGQVTAPPIATGDGESAATAPDKSAPTPAQVERQKYCDAARKNVDTLTNKPLVDMDINGTGKPVRLSSQQQTQQLTLAKQQVTALCSK